jgi:cation diffusion facilitator CzcD-associated flavoprotein CzcO
MVSRPSIDRFAQFIRKILPPKMAFSLTRWRNIWLQKVIYKKARSKPNLIANKLLAMARKEMPKLADFDKHFTPKYPPWEQRLCLVADGDMFKSLERGKAQIVTEHIERFTQNGVLLKSGQVLEADIIVTATGLNLSLLGQTTLSVDGLVVDLANHVYYKGVMFNDIPNFASIFGYVNASWTLKTDIAADYVCRLLATMDKKQVTIANPHLNDPDMPRSPFIENFSSGYIARSLDKLPKNGDRHPWRLLQDYAAEKKILTQEPIEDGVMVFGNAEPIAE